MGPGDLHPCLEHGVHRWHRAERGAARAAVRFRSHRSESPLGDKWVFAPARGAAALWRGARGPLRPATHLHGRDWSVHRCLHGVRTGADRRGADRGAGGAGRRGGDHDSRIARDDFQLFWTGRTWPGDWHLVGVQRAGHDSGTGARGTARGREPLARRLLHQPAPRPRRPGDPRAQAPAGRRRGGWTSTRPARCGDRDDGIGRAQLWVDPVVGAQPRRSLGLGPAGHRRAGVGPVRADPAQGETTLASAGHFQEPGAGGCERRQLPVLHGVSRDALFSAAQSHPSAGLQTGDGGPHPGATHGPAHCPVGHGGALGRPQGTPLAPDGGQRHHRSGTPAPGFSRSDRRSR
jgi:hypothetical protein